MQYKYKVARELIKHSYKLKKIYNKLDNKIIGLEMPHNALNIIIEMSYELLNNPNRFK